MGLQDWVGMFLMVGGAVYLYWAANNKQFPFNIMPPAPVVQMQQPQQMMEMTPVMVMTPSGPQTMMVPPSEASRMIPQLGGSSTLPPTQAQVDTSMMPTVPAGVIEATHIMKPAFMPITGVQGTTVARRPIVFPSFPTTTRMPAAMMAPAMMMAAQPPAMMPSMMMPMSTLDCGKTNPKCCGPWHNGNCHAECNRNPNVTLNTPGISSTCKQCLSVCGSYEGKCNCMTGMPK